MKRFAKRAAWIVGALALLAAWPAWRFGQEIAKAQSDDPTAYEGDIVALEAATAELASPEAVVFIGSSSIRLWSTLVDDMQPLRAIQHGFGGAKLADVEHYAERLVNAYRPRAVVVFAGTNDIHPGDTKPPEQLLATWQRFVAKVRAELPTAPIYFIAITPSPMRWEVWDVAQHTNQLVAEHAAGDPTLHVIDTGPSLLGPDGTPNRDNYIFDGLHLSAQGYAIWTELIRSRLLADLGN